MFASKRPFERFSRYFFINGSNHTGTKVFSLLYAFHWTSLADALTIHFFNWRLLQLTGGWFFTCIRKLPRDAVVYFLLITYYFPAFGCSQELPLLAAERCLHRDQLAQTLWRSDLIMCDRQILPLPHPYCGFSRTARACPKFCLCNIVPCRLSAAKHL